MKKKIVLKSKKYTEGDSGLIPSKKKKGYVSKTLGPVPSKSDVDLTPLRKTKATPVTTEDFKKIVSPYSVKAKSNPNRVGYVSAIKQKK